MELDSEPGRKLAIPAQMGSCAGLLRRKSACESAWPIGDGPSDARRSIPEFLRCGSGASNANKQAEIASERGDEAGQFLKPGLPESLTMATAGAIGPDHIRAELGEVLLKTHPGRTSRDELTLFKSLGIAIEDLAAAAFVYRKAQKESAGAWVKF